MAEERKVLQMVFSTELNNNHTIRIADPAETIGAAEIDLFMDEVVARNIFDTKGGDITGKISARIVTTTIDDIDML